MLHVKIITSRISLIMSQVVSRDQRSSGALLSVEWQTFTVVSGQRFGPIFKGQEVQHTFIGLLDA
jgi:hypothetical protein